MLLVLKLKILTVMQFLCWPTCTCIQQSTGPVAISLHQSTPMYMYMFHTVTGVGSANICGQELCSRKTPGDYTVGFV